VWRDIDVQLSRPEGVQSRLDPGGGESDLLAVRGCFSLQIRRIYRVRTDIHRGLQHVISSDYLRTSDMASAVHNEEDRRCALLRPGRFAGSQ